MQKIFFWFCVLRSCQWKQLFAEESRAYRRSRTSIMKKSEADHARYIPSTHIFIGPCAEAPHSRLKMTGGVERRRAGANSPPDTFCLTISNTCPKTYSHSWIIFPYSHTAEDTWLKSYTEIKQSFVFKHHIKEKKICQPQRNILIFVLQRNVLVLVMDYGPKMSGKIFSVQPWLNHTHKHQGSFSGYTLYDSSD